MKIKSYKLITAALMLGFGFTGCEDSLELEPRQSISVEVATSTEQNIENILVGAYAEAGQAASYGGRLQIMADLYGYTTEANWEGTFNQPRQVFTKNIFVDNSFVRDVWLNNYQVINQANLVIDNLDVVVDEDKQDRLEGQARFLRALAYFDLVRSFGAPYEAGQQNDQPGVPITLEGITDYSVNLEIPRNSVEEVYSQIEEDLSTAYDLLPPSFSSADIFFADKYSAQALLARVYLQQGSYPEARDAANDVIENSDHSLASTYAGAFNNDTNSSEDLFAFQVTTQSGTNQLIVHYADQPFGGRGGDIIINDSFINRFSAEDERGDFFYISDFNGGTLTGKYTNQFGNIPLIRLAEMYLIRAEGNFREGTTVGATPLDDINTINERAGADPLQSVDLGDILNERELELAFEGFLIHDLIRTERPVGDLPYDDNSLIFPIPEREMDVNPLLVQNPGYSS